MRPSASAWANARVERAVQYAKEREVFGRPIGKNQGIQFPLAESFAKLETAELMVQKAASLYDQGRPCGKEANISKYMAAEAACEAADRAISSSRRLRLYQRVRRGTLLA